MRSAPKYPKRDKGMREVEVTILKQEEKKKEKNAVQEYEGDN